MSIKKLSSILSITVLMFSSVLSAEDKIILRVGHFPNITHAQALVAHQLSRQGKGWFEQRLGDGVEIQWSLFNAGPTAMEALFANSLDITYVGPSPALNAYAKTRQRDIKIIAGAADGGAALVVNPKLGLKTPKDFVGKKIATPQMGNTQDVACRAWLIDAGLNITLTGGDAHILPTANPEQLSLFKQGFVDAVWTVEPWVTRLIDNAQGQVLYDQKEAVTTVLVTCNRVLKEHKELVDKFIKAHEELTDWIKAHPAEAQELVRKELEDTTRGKIAKELVSSAWKRLIFTNTVNVAELNKFVSYAYECGFIRSKIDTKNLFYKRD